MLPHVGGEHLGALTPAGVGTLPQLLEALSGENTSADSSAGEGRSASGAAATTSGSQPHSSRPATVVAGAGGGNAVAALLTRLLGPAAAREVSEVAVRLPRVSLSWLPLQLHHPHGGLEDGATGPAYVLEVEVKRLGSWAGSGRRAHRVFAPR